MNFPVLEVIERLRDYASYDLDYQNIHLVSVQHLVETTGSLFEAFIQIGFLPNQIHLKGKLYSTNTDVEETLAEMGVNIFLSSAPDKYGILRDIHRKEINKMWESVKLKLRPGNIIIILDDGGLTIRHTPPDVRDVYQVYGIEQTTSGLRFLQEPITFPVIQVATSAAKTLLEPFMISRALNRRLQVYMREKKPKRIGVIGYGHIGKSVAEYLSRTFSVSVFDNKPISQVPNSKIKVSNSMSNLIIECDMVIGATGVDISHNVIWEDLVKSDKVFLSVSSHDTEFLSLIKSLNYPDVKLNNVLRNIIVRLKNDKKLTIIRGGTVANFDNSIESCKKNEIQLTRGLLFSGVLQALSYIEDKTRPSGHLKLRANFQQVAIDAWFRVSPHYKKYYPKSLVENLKDQKWLESNS